MTKRHRKYLMHLGNSILYHKFTVRFAIIENINTYLRKIYMTNIEAKSNCIKVEAYNQIQTEKIFQRVPRMSG